MSAMCLLYLCICACLCVCVCVCVCVWPSALSCAFACDLRRLLHMHFIRVCLLFSEPLKDLMLDVLIRLCRLEPIAASPRLHARLPACHVESRWRRRCIYGLNLGSSSSPSPRTHTHTGSITYQQLKSCSSLRSDAERAKACTHLCEHSNG